MSLRILCHRVSSCCPSCFSTNSGPNQAVPSASGTRSAWGRQSHWDPRILSISSRAGRRCTKIHQMPEIYGIQIMNFGLHLDVFLSRKYGCPKSSPSKLTVISSTTWQKASLFKIQHLRIYLQKDWKIFGYTLGQMLMFEDVKKKVTKPMAFSLGKTCGKEYSWHSKRRCCQTKTLISPFFPGPEG